MYKRRYFLLTGLVLLAACSSTKIVSSWHEPNKTITITNLNKVLVVALFKNETTKHKVEDEMVSYLVGKGVVSYNYLNDNFNKKNEDAIRKAIKADGFDGAITMRLIDVDKEQVYTPENTSLYPKYYRIFSGYYFRTWGYSYTPGYYTTTKTYTIETNVYSIKEDKIIWSALTETTDPKGIDQMTEKIASLVYKKMQHEGFVQ
ncbi:MAG: hypothetical protein QM541_03060 [Flavobacterium sp.]|nr:hypothetical protein [Flavobacterium sp.]